MAGRQGVDGPLCDHAAEAYVIDLLLFNVNAVVPLLRMR